MGGGQKARRQKEAEETSAQTAAIERQRAEELRTELGKRRSIVGAELPETLTATRKGAGELYETGGFRPGEIEPVKSGYSEMALTGGFNPGEREQFLRRASAGPAAIYSRAKDELERQKVLQGGFMPGFTSSQNRLTRGAVQASSEASLGANLELARQIREGKLAGLGGQERIAEATQRGRVQGQDALQRYSQFGVSALSDVDITELRNRLQSGQISQNDAQLLTLIASQNKTLFENIMQGISTVGGAAAGILTGVGAIR